MPRHKRDTPGACNRGAAAIKALRKAAEDAGAMTGYGIQAGGRSPLLRDKAVVATFDRDHFTRARRVGS